MPSEKLTRILKAKSPFSAEQIEAMTEVDGWQWVYGNPTPHKERSSSVCFTGFSQSDRDELSALATGVHLNVVTSVTKSLMFLCAGDNAGPSKLTKANEHGIPILNRAEFVSFLESGEVPLRQREKTT